MTTILATQTLPLGGGKWDKVQGFSFVGTAGPDAERTWKPTSDRSSIGNHGSNDIVLNDPMVSRFHCEVLAGATGAQIVDLNSKNGTFVDDVRIRDADLKEGCQVRIGQSVLRFHMGGTTHPIRVSPRAEFGTLVGHSVAMRTMFELLERAAPTDATILLEGETGTGKGLTAESIHELSARKTKPFMVVDCASIPANLLESELFGHERGAFTGAVARRIGAFEAAAGGTIFLDEIGELPLELQPKLLRVLEEGQIRRVGSNGAERVDVRVIAATNRDLRKEVNEARFRSDLYFRLAVIHVRVPALREHPEDIPLLIERFLGRTRNGSDLALVALLRSPAFIANLQRAAWPGNVRELRNHVERCLVLQQVLPFAGPASSTMSQSVSLRAPIVDPRVPYHQSREECQMSWEREYLRALLSHHAENVDVAAQAAGISRAYLYRLLSRHGIRRST